MQLELVLLVDFGSTYTKVAAIDLNDGIILGNAQSPTTIESDVAIGFGKALEVLEKKTGIDPGHACAHYACSSAAGGLKIAAIGLVPSLTLEAARRAALGAGAKIVANHGYELDDGTVTSIERMHCDIILLCGGTDGGNNKVILHNASKLAASSVTCPVIVAGNRTVASRVSEILKTAGKKTYVTENVLPATDTLNVAPAQALIRDIFIEHIIHAKGLTAVQSSLDKPIIPTPMASLLAATLLADGSGDTSGIGSLLVVEVGGATVNIHSVLENTPITTQTILRGLPESRIKRTVEGDLGIRWNAQTILETVGEASLAEELASIYPVGKGSGDFSVYTQLLHDTVEYLPLNELEAAMDIALARSAVRNAVARHAGTLKTEWSINGEVQIQTGKNLLTVNNILGTGGVFSHSASAGQILSAALYSEKMPWSLRPQKPKFYLDAHYLMYGIGLLSQEHPERALRIAKKYIKPVTP